MPVYESYRSCCPAYTTIEAKKEILETSLAALEIAQKAPARPDATTATSSRTQSPIILVPDSSPPPAAQQSGPAPHSDDSEEMNIDDIYDRKSSLLIPSSSLPKPLSAGAMD